MARLARLTVGGMVHHVLQRGNNGQAIFVRPDDHAAMLELLYAHARQLQVAVHAYVMAGNQFQLLATPPDDKALSLLMQGLGRAYVRYFNRVQARSGTLWEGRYRCTLVQAEKFLLPCMAYIDTDPVRQGLVGRPADYQWSSHRHYVGQASDRLVTPHALFWALGNTPFAREAHYAEQVLGEECARQFAAVGDAAHKGWALGDAEFLSEVQKSTGRRLTRLPAGRPPGRARGAAQ